MSGSTIFLIISSLLLVSSNKISCSGHKVLSAEVKTIHHAKVVGEFEDSFDLWTDVRLGRHVDIHSHPEQVDDLVHLLDQHGVEHKVMIEDLEAAIEAVPMMTGSNVTESGHSMDWTSYHPIEDIHSYLDYLEDNYDIVSTESLGQSYEGSDMRIARVCKGGCGNKPAIWLDSGMRAREWIGPAALTYMLRELVENNDDHEDLTDNLDWYILPVMNPDGYLYTQERDRMWRKTRSTSGGVLGCVGTDVNCNFGFHWGDCSDNPCSSTFRGKEAFSEVETRNVRDFLLGREGSIKVYNSMRSYGQTIDLPWCWTQDTPDTYDQILALAMKGNQELGWQVGCVGCDGYTAGGCSMDWALGEAGIKYSFSMHLRDQGMYGFLLPANQIIPSGEEVWSFHSIVAREIIKEFLH